MPRLPMSNRLKSAKSLRKRKRQTGVGNTRRSLRVENLERRDLMAILISEVFPAGSSNPSYGADWFEVTNTGAADVSISGWKVDDSSNAFGTAVALRGVTTIPAGKSVIFLEGNASGSNDASIAANFSTAWFGSATPPAGILIGGYGGSGIGLSTSGDAVNLFDAGGNRIAGVAFGAASATATFDNLAGKTSQTLSLPTISTLSIAGVNGAFTAGAETGSPGRTLTGVDLSTYVRVGRYDLPEPTRTSAPANSLLAQEVSAVTHNWDTDTLFVVGDGGTSIVQVTKTGQLVNSMTLATGTSPQGTEFYDPEGLTYIGGGKFVMVEERDRRVSEFTYVAGGTLNRVDVQSVTLGTFIGNLGIEGISYDPQTGGFIAVKEIQPQGIFQTGIDFVNQTATNGSSTTENSIDLFNPALVGVLDFADIFALSNLSPLKGKASFGNLLVLSQESGEIVNIDRNGNVSSRLVIANDPGNPLSVAAQQHEGLTMDANGFIYVVSENGGGDFDHPQLWVYAPSGVPNQAPTAVALANPITVLEENTSTLTRVKVADISLTDDSLGTNNLTITGPDASFFEIINSALYLKAGTVLDFETKSAYNITVNVDDASVGSSPDLSINYSLTLTDVVNEAPVLPSLYISEVSAWSSGNSPVGADWFELTNAGSTPINLTGWKMDDSSAAFASAVSLSGISSIAPGESVIFLETSNLASTKAVFLSTWFGANTPATLQVGSYSGGGVGLSTSGDAVNLYNSGGALQASVSFGASPAGPYFASFNNAAGVNNGPVSQLSVVGTNAAFAAANDPKEIGSPGSVGRLFISEVAPWSSGNSPVGSDWFEVTNTTAQTIDLTGWKMDDSSGSFAASVALSGISSIAPGESVIFLETANLASTKATFLSTWFGASIPAGLQVGSYSGGGVGLSTSGDEVNLYNASGVLQARVVFGVASSGPSFASFTNPAAINNSSISQLSVAGVKGAFIAAQDANEVGSPGKITAPGPVASPDSYTAVVNAPLVVGPTQSVLANDSGNPLTVVSHTNPANGTLTINPDGTFTYTPQAGFAGPDTFTYTVSDAVQLYKTNLPPLATIGGATLTAGAYGSSLVPVPGRTDEYFGLTDRGPNVDGPGGVKVEPLPNFTPAIGRFKLVDGQAILLQYIPLKAQDGTPLNGQVSTEASTGETIVDLNGNVLPASPYGFDSEGLVALADGTFWISDEYGPYIVHFDATGKEIERLSPFNSALPAELKLRRPNRGMEGLTITPDGTTLVGMMQSALINDITSANTNSTSALRIVTYNLVTHATKQFLYLLDNPGTTGTAVSEITALSSTEFLVTERDGLFPPNAYKKIFKIDISVATDVGSSSTVAGTTYDPVKGLIVAGKTIENLVKSQDTATTAATLAANGITPVSKNLHLDLIDLLTKLDPQGKFFSHDKIEGVSVIAGGTKLVISNDSDFGIDGLTNSTIPYQLRTKVSPATGLQDEGEFLIVDLTRLPANTSTATVTINVNPNQAPIFTLGTSPVIATSGAQTVTNFASSISAGPASEAAQALSFVTTVSGTTGNLAFSSAPTIDPLTGNLAFTLAANTAGTATISVKLVDNGGTAAGGNDTSAVQTFVIRYLPTVQVVNGVLTIQGTASDDNLQVSQSGSQITVLADGSSFGPFDISLFSKIQVNGDLGNDRIDIDTNVTKPALLRGGQGSDYLQSGGGFSVLVGDEGADQLIGRSGSDLLIGNRTTLNDAALLDVLNEWTNGMSYSARVTSLRTKLTASTVLDDGAVDTLLESNRNDWAFATLTGTNKDKLSSKPGSVIN